MPSIASPRRPPTPSNRPVTRAAKRLRLSKPHLEPPKRSKRRYDERPPPSLRKRRISTEPTPPPAKRRQTATQEDVVMKDRLPQRRPRRRTLKDVIRSHRIKQAVIHIPVIPFAPTNASQPPIVEDQSDAHTQCSHVEQAAPQVYLTGDEQVDVIDISEASNLEDQTQNAEGKENPLQAHLLEDGRCFVRIARPDGTIDYYTLNPHQ